MTDKLRQARIYEEIAMGRIGSDERPAFHVTGGAGWINDPNGFSCYRGQYHLFYQYYPYANNWGPMHWGHVVSRDFVKWERLPIALAPDMEYDKGGCFSGSAVETPAGRHLLMYTGYRQVIGPSGELEDRQVQCMAVGDGLEYRKYEENPVLMGLDLPEGGSIRDFRDPKIWYDPEENVYYSVIVNRAADGSGAVLLYRSDEGLCWEYVTTLDASRNEYGKMWECPDFFSLDGEQVLLVSPEGMRPKGLEFHPGNNTLALLGDYDRETHNFTRKRVQAIDYGLDFYAPQTLEAPDGRRIMIGWMQSWAGCHAQPAGNRWFGQMTLPRELTIEHGRLCQKPIRELENYRKNPVFYQNIPVSEEVSLEGVRGRSLDMRVTVRPGDGGYRAFTMAFAKGGGCYSTLRFLPGSGEITVDRSHSGFDHDILHSRTFPVDAGEELKIRVILDRFSGEFFLNGGRQAFTMTLYTPQEFDGITFAAEGNASITVEKYDIHI